ncbi:DUF4184 family protein [Herbiconiux solani]|uniref:DUF4184 family protein n=1 Tax=Herbiconiux solani TaxID=661329 RepID=UPI0008240C9C|nr:DUF4184 family protein [Herbiconiux solani]
MPFTVSHAFVAVPFARTALPAGAVAAGAMVPDLPLFLPVGVSYESTHEFPWFLVTAMPLAFLAFAIWRVVVRPVARAVVPRKLAERLPLEWDGTAVDGWRSLWRADAHARPRVASALLLLAALLIGVLTHVVWDAFTHPGSWGTQLVPALNDSAAGIPIAVWLHYASSAVGLAALAVWLVLWLRHRAPTPTPAHTAHDPRRAFWLVMAFATAITVVVIALQSAAEAASATRLFYVLLDALTTTLGALTLAIVLASLAAQVTRTRPEG